MVVSNRFRTLMSCLTLLLVVAGTAPAGSRDRPFKGRVAAIWDNVFLGLVAPPARFAGGGPVTHMGLTRQTGTLVLEPPIGPNVYPGSGSVTITAANGDSLTFEYEGLLFAATGEGIGTFTFTGGTGRFANATGEGTFSALIDVSLPVNQPMTVDLNGTIAY